MKRTSSERDLGPMRDSRQYEGYKIVEDRDVARNRVLLDIEFHMCNAKKLDPVYLSAGEHLAAIILENAEKQPDPTTYLLFRQESLIEDCTTCYLRKEAYRKDYLDHAIQYNKARDAYADEMQRSCQDLKARNRKSALVSALKAKEYESWNKSVQSLRQLNELEARAVALKIRIHQRSIAEGVTATAASKPAAASSSTTATPAAATTAPARPTGPPLPAEDSGEPAPTHPSCPSDVEDN